MPPWKPVPGFGDFLDRRRGLGEGTTDEMCIAFLRVTVDAERLGAR